MTSDQVKLLVTYDGSDASRTVFDDAARMARLMGGSIVLIRVYHAPSEVWVHPDAAYREAELARLKAEWQAELDAVAAGLSSNLGVPLQAQARLLGQRWNVAGEILACADEIDAVMICMASHGEGLVRTFFVGSTTQEVLAASKRPIMLTRSGEDQ